VDAHILVNQTQGKLIRYVHESGIKNSLCLLPYDLLLAVSPSITRQSLTQLAVTSGLSLFY